MSKLSRDSSDEDANNKLEYFVGFLGEIFFGTIWTFFAVTLCRTIRRRWIRFKTKFPETCDTRQELYKRGWEILDAAQEHVTVVSTLGTEDIPDNPGSDIKNEHI